MIFALGRAIGSNGSSDAAHLKQKSTSLMGSEFLGSPSAAATPTMASRPRNASSLAASVHARMSAGEAPSGAGTSKVLSVARSVSTVMVAAACAGKWRAYCGSRRAARRLAGIEPAAQGGGASSSYVKGGGRIRCRREQASGVGGGGTVTRGLAPLKTPCTFAGGEKPFVVRLFRHQTLRQSGKDAIVGRPQFSQLFLQFFGTQSLRRGPSRGFSRRALFRTSPPLASSLTHARSSSSRLRNWRRCFGTHSRPNLFQDLH